MEFAGRTDWADATFAAGADFAAARFAAGATFAGGRFVGPAAFSDALFAAATDFSRAQFRGPALFASARFADVEFSGVAFTGGEADFTRCRFAGRGVFAGGGEGAGRIFAGAEVRCVDMAVDPAASVAICDADLATCRLLGTDLSGIRFLRVAWPRVRGRGEGRIGVYDELAPLAAGTARPWSGIARLYRDLKRQSLARGEHEEAGAFHCGEKEMQRRDPATPRSLRLLLGASWALWGHGERFLRPLGWLGATLLGSTLAYLLGGLVPLEGGAALSIGRGWDWLRAAHHALQTALLFTPGDLAPVQCAKGVETLGRVAGPLLVGLFLLAAWRRLRW